jgi:predicted O-linked N-acetylglucosamine transferase (SPINDLY family)
VFETILGRHYWHLICLLLRNLCRLLDTMNTTLITANGLPIEHWRNYLVLAQKGILHLDQMIQKSDQLKKEGQLEDALTLCKAYIEHTKHGDQDMALFNYGAMLQAANQLDDAEASYRKCIEMSSRLPQARINLGLLLEKKGNSLAALEQWQAVATLPKTSDEDSSNIVLALNHIGRVYENHKLYDLAENALEESLKHNPKQPGVIQHWVHIRQKSCKWPVYKTLPNISQNEMLMATSPLAMLALTDDPVQQLLTAYTFVERTYGFKEEFLCKGRRYQHDRLRVGYVSGDLCVHAVGLLLAELLEGHDRSKFEIYGYDFSPEDGTPHRARLKQAFGHLRPIHQLNDRQVAELVLADEIDVLIDLHGLSSGARPGIFALHPAPKQGTYLGFIGTTGMPWFDFVIADEFVLPKELTKYFTEK